MAQVDVLPAPAALLPRPQKPPHPFPTAATSTPDTAGLPLFPGLPPLLHGHPDFHMRNGVTNAARLADADVPNAEKAFFVADLSEVYRQHLRWKACLPDIQPFYAVKCNPDPYVLRLLAALGTGFDCASTGEIAQVLALAPPGHIDPARIIFANPCKPTSFIRSAAARGVHLMTFDNADELHKTARAHPAAQLVLRILTDDSKSRCAFGTKFGAPPAHVRALLELARELRLAVVGVSFHVGSGCYDPRVYADAVRRARAAFDVARECGFAPTLLDVGGGFEDALFEHAAACLAAALDESFPDRRERGVRVVAEPGRYYVANAFQLAANIIARRAPAAQPEAGDAPQVMYYINDGVYGAFNCILFDHQTVHPRVLALNDSFHAPGGALLPSSVWGPTCDSIDCVCACALLPAALRVGDWLAFAGMGAYTVCAASQFNGFEISSVVYTEGVGADAREVRAVLRAFAALE